MQRTNGLPFPPDRIASLNLKNEPSEDGCVRGSVLGPGQKQSLPSRIFSVLTLLIFTSWPYFMFWLCLACLFNRTALSVFLLLMSTLLLPAQLRWGRFISSYTLRTWQEYFRFAWTCEEIIRPDAHGKGVIFAEWPHGAFPFGPILTAPSCNIFFPDHVVFALGASAIFYLPGFKHFMRWIGVAPAGRTTLISLLQRGSVAVLVGGIAEMFMLADDHEEIMLKSRRGIAAVAVETNTPVVPVYHLGNSRLLKFGPQWLMGASRKLRTSLGLVFGRWCLPLPFKRPLHMLSGKALHPDKLTLSPGDEGYQDQLDAAVDKLLDRMEQELRGLYERHRHSMPGWEKRPLVIR